MQPDYKKTHQDGIWVSMPKEIDIVQQVSEHILQNNFIVERQGRNNYGYPYVYSRDGHVLNCRFVDSVFLERPEAWSQPETIITDNIPLQPVAGKLISVLPEFWSIWHFDPVYIDRPATWAYNCFMNRFRGDRSRVFYELLKRNILEQGIVSFNVTVDEYEIQFVDANLDRYQAEHDLGRFLVPYNNLTATLEQSIIDSCVSLVLETYTSDTHIVFSEKIFRALQLPRPWLLYCSPGAVATLRDYGFDVLDDCVDHSYDQTVQHGFRLQSIIDQLETFIDRDYGEQDYQRFKQAADHNQQLLQQFARAWPDKLATVLNKIDYI